METNKQLSDLDVLGYDSDLPVDLLVSKEQDNLLKDLDDSKSTIKLENLNLLSEKENLLELDK